MSKKIVLFIVICLVPFVVSSDEIYIDGYAAQTTEVQEFDGLSAAPSVSPTNKSRLYFDFTTDHLKLSENAGAYSNILTATSGGSLYLKLDASNDPLTGTLDAQHIFPYADDTYDFGEDVTEWRNIYIDGSAYIDSFRQSLIPFNDGAFDLGFSTLEWKDLHIDGQAYIDAFGQSLLPHVNNTFDIGSATHKWRHLYVEGIIYEYKGQNIIPAVDDTYDLGSSDYEWKDIYIDGVSYIDKIECSGIIQAGSGNHELTDATGLIDGEKIQDDTVDDDSIDFTDVTGADLTLTDCGAITSSADIQGANIIATTNVEATSSVIVDTMTLSTGSISDTSGSITIGNNVTVGGDLTVSGNIDLTDATSGHIKPTTDLAYELGGESKRYVRVCAKEFLMDPDTYFIFDENFVRLFVNGVEYASWGTTAGPEIVIDGTYSEEVIDGTYNEVIVY